MEFNTNEWPEIQASQNSIRIPCKLSAKKGAKCELKLDQGSKVNFPECTFLQLFCQLSLWKRPRVDRATRFFSALAFKENFLTGTSRSIHPFLQNRANGFLQFRGHTFTLSTGRCDVNESCLLIREKPITSLSSSLTALPNGRLIKKRSFVFISCNIHYC